VERNLLTEERVCQNLSTSLLARRVTLPRTTQNAAMMQSAAKMPQMADDEIYIKSTAHLST
jgi:hypothetical protein